MLNELLTVERSLLQAGVHLMLRQSEIKDAARKPTLAVFLNKLGHVSRVQAIPMERIKKKPLWKLSEGQMNSFPFVQPKPLWEGATIEEWKKRLGRIASDAEKRALLLDIATTAKPRTADLGRWAAEGMARSLRKRRKDLVSLEHSELSAFPEAIDRFLLAVDRSEELGAAKLVNEISDNLISEMKASTDLDLLAVAIALFTETAQKSGGLYFDVEGNFEFMLTDARIAPMLCEHLRKVDVERLAQTGQTGICSITGETGPLVVTNFSQPNLPAIRQSFLFAKNEEIPSAARYGRVSAESFHVGYMTDVRLRAALEGLCSEERKGITWRPLPGEAPEQRDLLLAFVDKDLDIEVADLFAENDMREDFSDEEGDDDVLIANSVAAFEERTRRMIDGLRAKVSTNWQGTPVHLIVLRAVDEANRKVVYAGTPTVADVYGAASAWVAGERNIPAWIQLWSKGRDKADFRLRMPPHIAPLGLISLSKQIFLRNGQRPPGKKKEQPGITAAEALKVFLTKESDVRLAAKQRIKRALRLFLLRRTMLLVETAHGKRRGWDQLHHYDVHEALRTVTLLGVLLHKLNRRRDYMSDTAFRLGQLLSAADTVHAGYCADVRKGALPPSLLGNQVFVMAQTAPAKALAALARRWKPYDGWAKKNSNYAVAAEFLNEQGKFKKRAEIENEATRKEFDKAMAIVSAISQRRKAARICEELAGTLPDRCDDIFRAELLLGYLAGVQSGQREDAETENPDMKEEG